MDPEEVKTLRSQLRMSSTIIISTHQQTVAHSKTAGRTRRCSARTSPHQQTSAQAAPHSLRTNLLSKNMFKRRLDVEMCRRNCFVSYRNGSFLRDCPPAEEICSHNPHYIPDTQQVSSYPTNIAYINGQHKNITGILPRKVCL